MNKKWIWLVSILAFFLLTATLILFLGTKKREKSDRIMRPLAAAGGKTVNAFSRQVKLFFFTDSSSLMVPVNRELEASALGEEIYKKFIQMLLEGQEGYNVPVPRNASLLAAYFLKNTGTLVLDFHENVRSYFPGGSSAEAEFVYFIVNNVCFNFREVKKVAFLFGGNQQKELSGHLDMERAYYPDFSWLGHE